MPTQSVTAGSTTFFTASDIAVDMDNDPLTITAIVTHPNPVTATAKLDGGTVTLTGVAAGITSLVVTVSDGTDTANVTVPVSVTAAPPILVTSITVRETGDATKVVKGETLQMIAEVLPPDATDKTVTWSVYSGTGTADINSFSGLLTGTGEGTVTVRATANDGSGVYGETIITVTAAPAGPDTTPPSVADGTITASSVTHNRVILDWSKATDDVSPQGALRYLVCFSYSSNIETVTDAVYNGTAVGDYATDISTKEVTGLESNTTYYFNVIVMDEAGNRTAYTMKSVTTKAAPHVNTAPNRKPGVSETAMASVTVNNAYTLNLSTIFEDADGDTLTYKVSVNGAEDIPANKNYSYTPTVTGTTMLVFRANDVTVDSSDIYRVILTATGANGGGGGSSSTSTGTPVTPTYKAKISGIGTTVITLPVNTNTKTGNAVTELETTLAKDIFAGTGTAVLTVPSIPGMSSYTLGIPSTSLPGSQGKGALVFSTGTGSVTIPSDMLAGIPETEGKQAGIIIGQGDKSNLPEDVRTAIGDRPLIQLTLTLDGKRTEWNNPDAPMTVSIPYTPTAKELADPEHIVVWYIDGSGNIVSVPNGRYDPATGTVTFTTTHFSYYAVSYKQVSFRDVVKDAWYAKAVSFIAARDITSGTGDGNFSPEAKLTRGQFIVMLMKAYSIAPDANPVDNFADAGNTWYTGYLAAAKKLGISAGVGNNMFAPEKEITRQEMFTLLYNTLKAMGKLPQGNSGKSLSDFSDAGEIASWAKEAVKLLVETGTIGGSGDKLLPRDTATRAEMAQMLYNLLSK